MALAELATARVTPNQDIHLSHTELANLDMRRRALRQQIVQKRIEYRRRAYALQSGKNISLHTIFCSCWTLGPRFSWLVQDIIEGLDTAGETERLQLYEYYVKMTEDYEVKARRAGWWLYHLQSLRTTFNIVLPAVLALQNVSEVSHVIMWLTWGLSLAVSLATGYIDLYRLRDTYEMYTRACEHLKLEGWQFFALTGRYAIFENHQGALHIFLMRVAKIRKRTIDREFPPQSGSGTSGADVSFSSFSTSSAAVPAPKIASTYSNSAAHRSPATMQSQPSTSSSERPLPPRSRAAGTVKRTTTSIAAAAATPAATTSAFNRHQYATPVAASFRQGGRQGRGRETREVSSQHSHSRSHSPIPQAPLSPLPAASRSTPQPTASRSTPPARPTPLPAARPTPPARPTPLPAARPTPPARPTPLPPAPPTPPFSPPPTASRPTALPAASHRAHPPLGPPAVSVQSLFARPWTAHRRSPTLSEGNHSPGRIIETPPPTNQTPPSAAASPALPPPPPPPGFIVATLDHHHKELANAQLIRSKSLLDDSEDDSGTDKDISM